MQIHFVVTPPTHTHTFFSFFLFKPTKQQWKGDKWKGIYPVAVGVCCMPKCLEECWHICRFKLGLTPRKFANILYCHIKLAFFLNVYMFRCQNDSSLLSAEGGIHFCVHFYPRLKKLHKTDSVTEMKMRNKKNKYEENEDWYRRRLLRGRRRLRRIRMHNNIIRHSSISRHNNYVIKHSSTPAEI